MTTKYQYSTGERIQYLFPNKYSAILQANGEDTITVPKVSASGYTIQSSSGEMIAEIVVNDDANVWMALDKTAVIPTSTFAVTDSELIPIRQLFKRIVCSGQVLHFITADDETNISVNFYQN